MKRGHVWLACVLFCVLFWGIVVSAALICCGAKAPTDPAKEIVSEIAQRMIEADKPQEAGIRHLAGIDTDLIWRLPPQTVQPAGERQHSEGR